MIKSIVSIIIPVYNVERYLRRCLDSALAQTFADWECVVVDDGSPDGCPAICDEYAARDGRFRVLHKPRNEGLPAARKTGLDAASGEFVTHLDSDDWLEPRALEALYAKQRETGADVVTGGMTQHFSRGTVRHIPPEAANRDALVWFFENTFRYLCGKLYRKKLFDSYEVPAFTFGEDVAVNAQIFSRLGSGACAVDPYPGYNYERRGEGITRPRRMAYVPFLEYPQIKAHLWVGDYLKRNGKYDAARWNYIEYMLKNSIYRYLRYTRGVRRGDAARIFQEYYAPFPYKNRLPLRIRLLIALFHRSLAAGSAAAAVLNGVSFLLKG